MASVHSNITTQRFLPIYTNPIIRESPKHLKLQLPPFPPLKGISVRSQTPSFKREQRRRDWGVVNVGSIADEVEMVPILVSSSSDLTDTQQEGGGESSMFLLEGVSGGFSSSLPPEGDGEGGEEKQSFEKFVDRSINATIVLAAGTFAVTRLLTVDRDYWHGWTIYEILRYAPQHSWFAYEDALKTNPVLAKMMISGVVYSLGDWIAQCYEGKPLFEFDRTRMFRSGLVGFSLHGSLSHYYYQICEALFPYQDWWAVLVKVAFDQTVWAAIWNSIYFVVLGFLRFESPVSIFSELKATFLPMLTVSN
ncbi:hypothetical protein GIB67_028403 [Kingdonia uniflora]|uniref:Peroxisomal membrane protein 2 n=1 Tax=Kingdonia uniflora TaxID=39325 RepID=A0A7J7MI40_9MAGN|nr:hypothetical protein GIB67_028403 [Kingdonia uniflora]